MAASGSGADLGLGAEDVGKLSCTSGKSVAVHIVSQGGISVVYIEIGDVDSTCV